jgi:hypothetical protein
MYSDIAAFTYVSGQDGCSLVDCAWLSAQVNEAAEIIYDLVDPNANLIFGAVVDQALGQEVSPTSPLCMYCAALVPPMGLSLDLSII